MDQMPSSRMEFGSSLAKAIYWVNLLVSDLEPPHIVKDCLWEYGCKHHVQKLKDKISKEQDNAASTSLKEYKKSPLINNNLQEEKTNMDLVWKIEQPVMFGFVADRRTSFSRVDISFNEDEYMLAAELKQMIVTLTD